MRENHLSIGELSQPQQAAFADVVRATEAPMPTLNRDQNDEEGRVATERLKLATEASLSARYTQLLRKDLAEKCAANCWLRGIVKLDKIETVDGVYSGPGVRTYCMPNAVSNSSHCAEVLKQSRDIFEDFIANSTVVED